MVLDSRGDRQSEARLRVLCAQVSRRIVAGERRVVERVLTEHPDFGADDEARLELIYAEFLALDESGEEVVPEAWYRRFPDLKPRLERLFSVHQYFDDADGIAPGGMSAVSHGTTRVVPDTQRDDVAPRRWASVPTEFGGYEILDVIGRGGMGVVYRARQKMLDRIVALKIIHSDAADSHFDSRFLREAESVARLHHANVVQIHDVGHEPGYSYLALEYVDGGSLADAVCDRPINPADAARIVELVARAMKYAHDRGVIHRDLKPANILLTSDGVPKIADFGLAKQLAAGDAAPTRTGVLMGTPSYMAPEQAEGRVREIGPGTDVYALGAVLYEMLTGIPPFRGESDMETLDLVRFADPVAPRKLNRRIARDLETICLKCLEKRQQDRYATGDALADDLQRYIHGDPIRSRKTPWTSRAWRWCRRRPVVASLSLALAVVLVVSAGVVAKLQLDAETDRRAFDQTTTKLAEKVRVSETEAERSAERAAKRRAELVASQLSEAQSRMLVVRRMQRTPGREAECASMAEAAVQIFAQLLVDNPRDDNLKFSAASASVVYGGLLVDVGRWEEAPEHLEQARRAYRSLESSLERPELIHCLSELGRAYRLLDRPALALEYYREAFERTLRYQADRPVEFIAPGSIGAFNGVAEIYRLDGQWDEAKNCCRLALEIFVVHAPPALPAPSPVPASPAQKKNPPVVDALKNPAGKLRTEMRIVGSSIRRALTTLNARGLHAAGRSDVLEELSEIAAAEGNAAEARRLAEEAWTLRQSPGIHYLPDAQARLARSHLQLARLSAAGGDVESAENHYRSGLEQLNYEYSKGNRTAPHLWRLADARVEWANTTSDDENRAGLLVAALAALRELHALRTSDTRITHRIAALLIDAGRTQRRIKDDSGAEHNFIEARNMFYGLQRNAPDNLSYRYGELLALVELIEHAMDRHKRAAADTALEIALRLGDALVEADPANKDYRRTTARAYSQQSIYFGRQRKMHEAMVAYRRAVELDPGVTGQGLFREAGKWFQQQVDRIKDEP